MKIVVLCSLLLSAAARAAAVPHERRRPNIIVFMADTLRSDSLGCYGQKVFKTPGIDAFAAGGVRFADAFSQSAWTRDSIATLFTGQYHWANRVSGRRSRLAPGAVTLARLLSGAGYKTGAVNANPNIDKAFGMDQGFSDFIPLYGLKVAPDRDIAPSEVKIPANKVVDEALAWIKKRRDEPFFLFVLATDPHGPYQPPSPYDTLYADRGAAPFPTLPGPSRSKIIGQQDLYGGEVSYLDAQFGRFLSALDALGLGKDAAIVFLADHGEEFYEHGRPFHGRTLYDPAIRVPLIVRYPAHARPGRVVDGLVEVRDLFPTILGWAGVGAPPETDAQSLTDCLAKDCPGRAAIVSTLDLDRYSIDAVRDRNYKLLSFPALSRTELFDLSRDPGEYSNISSSRTDVAASYSALLERVKALSLRKGKEESRAPLPLDENVRQRLKAMGYMQ